MHQKTETLKHRATVSHRPPKRASAALSHPFHGSLAGGHCCIWRRHGSPLRRVNRAQEEVVVVVVAVVGVGISAQCASRTGRARSARTSRWQMGALEGKGTREARAGSVIGAVCRRGRALGARIARFPTLPCPLGQSRARKRCLSFVFCSALAFPLSRRRFYLTLSVLPFPPLSIALFLSHTLPHLRLTATYSSSSSSSSFSSSLLP